MPKPIRRLAQTYLRDPEEITIETKTATVASIRQRYLYVPQREKQEALLRVLDTEDHDGMIIFTRTREGTMELADSLQQAGYRAAALNGDLDQKARELVVEQLRAGRINLLVATDVAARGLDVPRISHVVNYDIPFDAETYVHRIGRTGRAGREGDAILFVTPRDKRLLHNIERVTRQQVTEMQWPSAEQVNAVRKQRFVDNLLGRAKGNLQPYLDILAELEASQRVNLLEMAAALASIAQGGKPFYVEDKPRPVRPEWSEEGRDRNGSRRRRTDAQGPKSAHGKGAGREQRPGRGMRKGGPPDAGMRRYRIEVGKQHDVKPGNIVGAIANEIGISSAQIGRIELYPGFSTVDLPDSLSRPQLNHLKSVWVAGRQLNIQPDKMPTKKNHKR
jgi:ATP-dependent RNA helicase DeaD